MTLIENKINEVIKTAFEKAGFNEDLLGVKPSTHADFQCNDALPLAKKAGRNPREIASEIVENLKNSDVIESAEIAGPGFINLTLKNYFLSSVVEQIDSDKKHGFVKYDAKQTVMLDYCSPNLAKELHVGHLRSVIGESVKKIEQFCGNETIADNHLGDWGTPLGKIICELEIEQPELCYFDKNKTEDYPEESPLTVEELGALYVRANLRCKEDEEAATKARIATAELQGGRAGYRALWKHFVNISINDLKQLLSRLDISFDVWEGESMAQDILDNYLMAELEPYTEMDSGAKIISLKEFETNKTLPPVLIVKTDGGYTYHSSDLAALHRRINHYKADKVLYFMDARQSLHMEQISLAAKKSKIIKENNPIVFCGFGTVNGKNGKPFATRDGGVATLRSLIEEAFNKAKDILPKAGAEHSEEEINTLAKQISVGALKFNDMKNPRTSDYVFDMDAILSFEGKTGPYMQYAIARINSILDKAEGLALDSKIVIKEKEERALSIQIDAFAKAVSKAYENKDPYFIADYSYELAKSFSSFYTACPILNNENEEEKLSRLHLAKTVREILITSLGLLGIESPYKMLRG
ncbi:MAG: arginine--tRNA ligase [Alphaproteobacteria bacterium]|nr:arginine--tRNA ligase [Alphaproteobacteria bacterium]